MNEFCSAPFEAKANRIVQRARRWWRRRNTGDQYLAAATDPADLERRMRILERESGGPAVVPFNH
jgi:Protein of unknown function (DUF3563)